MIEIYTETLINIIILFPYFKLPGFSEYKITSNIYDAWFILSAVIIIYRIFKNKYRPSNLIKVIIVLLSYLFVNTVICGGFSTPLIRHCIGTILLSVYTDFELRNDSISICNTYMYIFACYTIANFLCGYNKIFSTYLFGQRTNFTVISVPMIIIAVLLCCSAEKYGHKRSILKVALILIFNIFWIIKESVSTALIALFVFAALMMLAKIVHFNKVSNIAYVVFFVLYNVVVVVIQSFDYMRSLFNVLGESMTLTGRLEIWNNAMSAILKKPLSGYGFELLIIERNKYAASTSYAHNEFIQQCVEGGLIQLILFIVILIVATRYCSKNTNSVINRYFLAGFIGMCITMFTEIPSSLNYFYVFLVLMEYITNCEAEEEEESEEQMFYEGEYT